MFLQPFVEFKEFHIKCSFSCIQPFYFLEDVLLVDSDPRKTCIVIKEAIEAACVSLGHKCALVLSFSCYVVL